MDEIQELRALVQTLQGELQLKDRGCDFSEKKQQVLVKADFQRSLSTPTKLKAGGWENESEISGWLADVLLAISHNVLAPGLCNRSPSTPYVILFLLSVVLGDNWLEMAFCLLMVVGMPVLLTR